MSLYSSDYLRNSLSARLAYWKKRAAGNAPEYRDWRKTAKGSIGYMVKPEGFSQGYNGEGRYRKPVYVAFSVQIAEQDAQDVISLDHTGWYTGTDCHDLAIGIVAKLPHNRWLAGYRLTMNDERVYFAEIHDTAEDAARMADEHARIIGEEEMENSQQWDAAQALQSEVEDMERRLSVCLAARHSKHVGEAAKEEARELIEAIREKRETLATDYKDFL